MTADEPNEKRDENVTRDDVQLEEPPEYDWPLDHKPEPLWMTIVGWLAVVGVALVVVMILVLAVKLSAWAL